MTTPHPLTARFADTVGVETGEWPERLQAAIRATGRTLRDRLANQRTLVDDEAVTAIDLALPPILEAMISCACAAARNDDEAALYERHYTELVPRILASSLWHRDDPANPWLHMSLEPDRVPRLERALEAMSKRLGGGGRQPAHDALAARALNALRAGVATLARLYATTHFGTSMPMLYTFPHDIAALDAELAAGRSRLQIIDDRLAAPFVHELSHLATTREPLMPPYLEECVAGWLGCVAMPALAWPEPDADHALYAAPWFAQVGDALADTFGAERAIAAHSGERSWTDVLGPTLLATLTRLGWAHHLALRAPHFLGETHRPRPWTRLLRLARSTTSSMGLAAATDLDRLEALPGLQLGVTAPSLTGIDDAPNRPAWDADMLERALRTACLAPHRGTHGEYRVTNAWPGTIVLDWRELELRAEPLGCDPTPVRYPLPMRLCRAKVAAGVDRETVEFDASIPVGDVPDIVRERAERLAVC